MENAKMVFLAVLFGGCVACCSAERENHAARQPRRRALSFRPGADFRGPGRHANRRAHGTRRQRSAAGQDRRGAPQPCPRRPYRRLAPTVCQCRQRSKPDVSVNDAPNSNTVNVVLAKQAPLIVGGEMHFFFSAKVKSLGGDPAKLVRLGASARPRRSGRSWSRASRPLTPTDCRPLFSKGTRRSSSRRAALPPTSGRREGFVLRFSNGLIAYLSGDTGITAEQEVVVRRYHGANLVVMSVGGAPNMTGPSEAALS